MSAEPPPLIGAQSGPAVQFAKVMHNQLVAAGLQPSTYLGTDGLYGRPDLAGLNLAAFPSILVECGSMKNAQDAVRTPRRWRVRAIGASTRLPSRVGCPPISGSSLADSPCSVPSADGGGRVQLRVKPWGQGVQVPFATF